MSRLFISVGFASKKGSTVPELVYLGRSGADQQSAEAASHLPHLLRFNHAVGIPKNNSRASANAALKQSAPVPAPQNSPEQGQPSQAPSTSAAEPAEASKPGARRR